MRCSLVILAALFGISCSDNNIAAPDDTASPAGTIADAELAGVIDEVVRRHELPALAALLIADGQTVAQAARGERKLGAGVAVTTDDLWHLGSCTKAMTATLVARLVEQGQLTWEQPIVPLFPGITPHADFASLTFDLLLTHRAGTYTELVHRSDLWPPLWDTSVAPREHRKWFAEQVLARAPEFPPDSRYAYSNAGYMIAGAALEQITDTPWEDLMRQHVFTPLGMNSCGFGAPATPGQIDQPWAHRVDGSLQPVQPGPASDNPAPAGPAGTVHCSLGDWAKFVAAHTAPTSAAGYLSADSFARLQAPADGQDYSLGWAVVDRSWAGGRVLTHAGSNTMFFAKVWAAPAKDKAIMVVTNRGDEAASDGVAEVVGYLIDTYF